MKGKIKFYNRSKDFGFILGENQQEYYFNVSSLKIPRENDEVEFEAQTTGRGEVAKVVTLLNANHPSTRPHHVIYVGIFIVVAIAAFLIGRFI